MKSPTWNQILHFFFFFLFFLINHLRFTNAKDIFLNCGSSSDYSIGLDGHIWTGDSGTGSKFIASEQSNETSIVSKSINLPSSLDPAPYLTARIFQSPFTYSFSVSPGQKFVRLYFNPTTYQGFKRSTAFFTVTAGPFTLLSHFSPSLTADSLGLKTLVKEFCLNIEENQVLNITFSPSSTALGTYAFINGIEIVSMPTNLYYTKSIVTRRHGSVQNTTALEMILRLNVGGRTISPVNDSGWYRGWLEDKAYFQGSGDQLVNASIRIKYSKAASYVAPAKVYQTARTANKQKSLSWNLTVDAGFAYLVRLHLCDLHPYVAKRGSRKFLIRSGNGKTEIEADVVRWSGGWGIAAYRDYVVKMPNVGNFGKTDLLISLGNNTNLRALNSDPILNGLEVFKLSDSQCNLAGVNPASKNAPISSPQAKKPKYRKLAFIIGGATLAAFTVILLFGLIIFCPLRRRKSNAKDQSVAPRGLCRRFTLDELRDATNNFNRALVIGSGGFGTVFKGCIDGGTPAAIKALKPTSTQGSDEFEAEIKMLSDLRHPHIVSLIGYCDENGVKIIVYDYMPRGTLRDHLYRTEGPPLSWKQRLEICIGVARGLKYLHTENPKIIHRDIKPSNILLDENWVAKVSDFGLSRLGPTSLSRSHVTTGVKGTFGYLDPEYFQTSHLSAKSDVYSFGVVLFEILCARPAEDLKLDNEQQSLAEWIRQCIKAGKLKQIMDPNLKGKIAPGCLKACVSIAWKCLNNDRHKRPTMSAVLKTLEHAFEVQECANAASDEEIMSSNGMEVVLRPCNNSKVVHSCPTFWNKTISHKELFRFLSDKAGLKWARPPALRGLQAHCCTVPGYPYLSRNGQMSNSSDCGLCGTPGRAMVPILLDDDDAFKL